MSDKKILHYDPQTGEPVYAEQSADKAAPVTAAGQPVQTARPTQPTETVKSETAEGGVDPDLVYKPVDPTMGDMIKALKDVMPDLFDDNMSTAMPLPESSAAVTARAFRESQQQNLEAKAEKAAQNDAAAAADATAVKADESSTPTPSPYTINGAPDDAKPAVVASDDGDDDQNDDDTYTARSRRPSRATAQHVLQLPKANKNGDYSPRDCAGFYTRLAAFAVDGIISGAAALVITALLRLVMADVMNTYVLFNITLGGVISYVITTAYFVILTSCCGMTLGKRLMRICVVSVDKEPLRFWQVLYRETVGRYLSSILCLGYIVLACDRRHRGFHDMLADTRVVYCG